MQKHLMTKNDYEKYVRFTNKQEIHKNPNLKECPSVDCEGLLVKPSQDSATNLAECEKCLKVYCYKCLH